MNPSVGNEVIATIREICHPAEPDLSDPSRPLLESGLDSLDYASVLMALEDKYEIEISEDDMNGLRSIDDISKFLDARIG